MKSVNLAELDPNDAFGGLTSRQEIFATLSFAGFSDADAYRQAYDRPDASYDEIATATKLTAHNPLVVARLKTLVGQRAANSTLAPWLSREWIANGIADLARHADKDSTKLNAFIALGKMSGIDMFRETVRHENVTRKVEDVDDELRVRLEELRKVLTIEGKVRPVEPGSGSPLPKDRRRKPQA